MQIKIIKTKLASHDDDDDHDDMVTRILYLVNFGIIFKLNQI